MLKRLLGALAASLTKQKDSRSVSPLALAAKQVNKKVPSAIDPYRTLNTVESSETRTTLGDSYVVQAALQRAVEHDPTNMDARFQLGLQYYFLEEYDKALQVFIPATRISSNPGPFFRNIIGICRTLGRIEDMEGYCHDHLRHDPRNVHAWIEYAHAASLNQNPELAMQRLDQALKLDPDNARAHVGKAAIFLKQGLFREGWEHYEKGVCVRIADRSGVAIRPWSGYPLGDETLLIFGEQGLGDELLFASCLPDVLRLSNGCYFVCMPQLVELFSYSFPAAKILPFTLNAEKNWIVGAPQTSFQIPMGSLPTLFRADASMFPKVGGYLKAPERRARPWRRRLAECGRGMKIGISWRGGTRDTNIRLRSVDLSKWGAIFRSRDAIFVNLQYNYQDSELLECENVHGKKLHTFPDALKDFTETAALVSSLDLVISVPTSVVTLANGLNIPVWVMVPAYSGWMFPYSGDKSVWFPTARLFRQSKLLEWDVVVDEVGHALSAFSEPSVIDA